MSLESLSLQARVLGPFADTQPVVVEKVAIEVTNALRGAESGIRGFRRRPLLRRLWDGVTGQGQELQAAISQDLVVAQRSTLALVREVMREEARTQHCVDRVLVNLHAVNRDLDEVMKRTSHLERELDRRMIELRNEFYEALRLESEKLADQIGSVRRDLDREIRVRRLRDFYLSGDSSLEVGELLGASLYIASIAWMHWEDGESRVREETKASVAVVKQRLPTRRAQPTDELLLEVAGQVRPQALEGTLYLAGEHVGVLGVVGRLIERRMGALPVLESHAEEAVAITKSLGDPERQLEEGLMRDFELIEMMAGDLLPVPSGKEG